MERRHAVDHELPHGHCQPGAHCVGTHADLGISFSTILVFAGTRVALIRLGHVHRGKVVTVAIEDRQFRIMYEGVQLAVHPRTVIKGVTRRSASGHINYDNQAGPQTATPTS
jgi:hypothetical protein